LPKISQLPTIKKRCLKIFYFHIFNITKFGWNICLRMITTWATSQSWKKNKKWRERRKFI
jgi:hypothetical protein